MARVFVKTCGTTNLADARYCASLGADYLGFIQHEPSPRYVEPDLARDIIEWVEGPRSVGVFVDETADEVNRIAESAGFDLVQLHGSESAEYCRSIDLPVIKVIHVNGDDTSESLEERMARYESSVSSFLLDTKVDGKPGGTGTKFDWQVAKKVAQLYPVFLAGGLTPDNVAEAVSLVGPVGVDVVSGIEEAPGRKSFEEVDRFFAALESN
jgi:phosphoribosylanthranilate isomerase